ncbi:delta-60 repeat domain-containing protein, partial [Streptomyces lavendulae]|uniref:delta-60 repeat domain-containing protein n=1 Tax=Streptomyces lavendulae TaxID=1914 RepID=UPI0036EAEE51
MKEDPVHRTSLRFTARAALVAAVSVATALALALPAQAAPGDLDATFSGDGKTTTDFSPAQPDIANDVAVQPDGKIVAVGRDGLNLPGVGGTAQDAVARYNTDGSLDAGFGSGGKVPFRFFEPPNTNFARNVFIQSDQKILAVGLAGPNEQTAFATLARLNTNGSLDTSFGPNHDGKVTLKIPNNAGLEIGNGFRGVAQQADGKIVAA